MNGHVSFVGSGPGDPELLTIKAINRLKTADVVLFDDLSAGDTLNHVSSGATLVGVGKRAGRQSPKQKHVSRLIVEYAMQGVKVVRLKSGDPGIFGRLEEEIDALLEANIPFEIIPGVTAASAAAAAASIPLTRRLSSRRLQFITGHDVSGTLPNDLNMAALTDPKCTTVIYMPKRTFPILADQLIAHGLPKNTPAILAENISYNNQKITGSTLAGLATKLKNVSGSLPALILLGSLSLNHTSHLYKRS